MALPWKAFLYRGAILWFAVLDLPHALDHSNVLFESFIEVEFLIHVTATVRNSHPIRDGTGLCHSCDDAMLSLSSTIVFLLSQLSMQLDYSGILVRFAYIDFYD